jgi:PAS domain S-box-containing protein
LSDKQRNVGGRLIGPPNLTRALYPADSHDSQRFQQVADNLQEVFALSNADLSELLYVNRAYERISGRTVESLYADPRSFLDAVYPQDRQRFEQAIYALIRGTQINDLECRVNRSDGTTAWVSCRAYPIREDSGQIQCLVGIAQEITERKTAEDALRLSEDRYRDLVENSRDLICTHDIQGVLKSVNELPLQILGYTREEVLNKPMRDLVPPEARSHCDEYLAQIRENGSAKGILPVLTKSGEVRLWEFNNSLRTEGLNSPVVHGLAHDVTDQKRDREQLQRSEALLLEGQKLTHTGSWIWNSTSGELLVSLETARIFELDTPTGKASLKSFLRYVHPDDRSMVERSFECAALEKRDLKLDYRIVLPNGTIKYIHSLGRPVFRPSGKFLEFIGTVMDVTERKNIEDELRQLTGRLLRSQEEERRKIAQDLHSTTSQDLIAIITQLNLLKDSLRRSDHQETLTLISECEEVAKHCLDETRTLCYSLFPPMLDRAGLEKAVRHDLDGFTVYTGIQVELEISKDFGRIPPEVELALYRVVQGTLANIKLHSQSRTAQIKLHRIARAVLLEISDQGRGMSMKERDGEVRAAPGVGIASMTERVKNLGGSLEIESSSAGTTVRVGIPIHESTQ